MISDLAIVVRTLWGEARGEPVEGQIAVVGTLIERAKIAKAYCLRHSVAQHPLFGDGTLASAALMPEQYSCWIQRERLMALDPSKSDYAELYAVAQAAVSDKIAMHAPGATHYYAPAACAEPKWVVSAQWIADIGNHKFYRAV
jgi:spore germination cell wall hydrolase CwlJ-like protein